MMDDGIINGEAGSLDDAGAGLLNEPYFTALDSFAKEKGGKVTIFSGMVEIERPPVRILGTQRYMLNTRGQIVNFSDKSRMRMMKFVSKIRTDKLATLPVFVTLTYPGGGSFINTYDKWKRDLDAMIKRIRRKYPHCRIVWRMEIKKRRSGELKGEFVPHFHLLLWLDESYAVFVVKGNLQWLSQGWYEVVGSGEEKHLRAGTNCREVRNVGHVMAYVTKYMAKIDDVEGIPPRQTGRFWGYSGDFDTSAVRIEVITEEEWQKVKQFIIDRAYHAGFSGLAYWGQWANRFCILGQWDAEEFNSEFCKEIFAFILSEISDR